MADEMPPELRAFAHVAQQGWGAPLEDSFEVDLHFQPDRDFAGQPLIRRMAIDGRYHSQFETGTSNGGLTAHPGGDRWKWESRLFGGAYDEASPKRRPVYGALNHRKSPYGASPRFGSAYFRLNLEVLERTTLCFPDSVFEPTDVAVPANAGPLVVLSDASDFDELDNYIEAHVHGPVLLKSDVAALVLDPSYRDTEVERVATKLPFAVEWHAGYALTTDEFAQHADYRGAEVIECGLAIAQGGALNPVIIGEAMNEREWDAQLIKKVWHCLARFGKRVG